MNMMDAGKFLCDQKRILKTNQILENGEHQEFQ